MTERLQARTPRSLLRGTPRSPTSRATLWQSPGQPCAPAGAGERHLLGRFGNGAAMFEKTGRLADPPWGEMGYRQQLSDTLTLDVRSRKGSPCPASQRRQRRHTACQQLRRRPEVLRWGPNSRFSTRGRRHACRGSDVAGHLSPYTPGREEDTRCRSRPCGQWALPGREGAEKGDIFEITEDASHRRRKCHVSELFLGSPRPPNSKRF